VTRAEATFWLIAATFILVALLLYFTYKDFLIPWGMFAAIFYAIYLDDTVAYDNQRS